MTLKQENDELMKATILLKKGESRYPFSLPVTVEPVPAGKWYWLGRHVPDSYGEGTEWERLPYPPFTSEEAAVAFLNKNWPKWLGVCDVLTEAEQLYVCDEEGERVYGRDVSMFEIYENLFNGVNLYCRAQYDEYCEGFYNLLVATNTKTPWEARWIADFLKRQKLHWIEMEPIRVRDYEERKAKEQRPFALSGLRGYGPQIREADLAIPHAYKLVLDAGVLYGNVASCALQGCFTEAISSENTWLKG